MNKKLQRIAVVGGGTAGFVAALILKTSFPTMTVDVIRSKKIGIIGVGEGSTEHWTAFMDFIGVNYKDVIRSCDSTFKAGILFKDWGPKDYMQSIGSGFNSREQKYPYVYAHQISKNADPRDMLSSHAWDNRVNTWFLSKEEIAPTAQFHFNTNKLNDFLTSVAEQKGVGVFDDEILDSTFDEQGNIDQLIGENQKYNYDFYIDCTGFKRILIEKLGAKWQSHAKYLKMKSAIVFPTEHKDPNDLPMWTTAQAMSSGWMFTIPVYDRNGNGYIFDSDFISAEEAKLEVESALGREINVGKQINFDPGYLDQCWIKNCCAIGLSANFVEPLEASSIGTSIQQSFLLRDLLINYNDHTIEKYNKIVSGIMLNIRDFIVLHYLTGREDTDFWKSLSTAELPDSLKTKLDIWQTKMPTVDDFIDSSDYRLFTDFHFILVLHGLQLFDTKKIKEEYLSRFSHMQNVAEDIVMHGLKLQCDTIPHKTMLDIIRNTKKENY